MLDTFLRFAFGRLTRRVIALTEKIDRVLFILGDGRARTKETIMATVQDIKDKVAKLTTVSTSVEALLSEISQQLKDAIANGASPADLQAIADGIDSNIAGLSAAVTANTPAAPPVAPASPTP